MTVQFGALVVVALTAWVALDAARRQRLWFAWAGLVALTGILGLVPWLIVRRRSPVVIEELGARRALGILGAALPLFVLVALLAIVTSTFVIQPARIRGQAMAPALRDGDRVLVNMLAYRRNAPRAGDIVMMHYPNRPSRLFVMRVIAEEGDQVRIVDGRIYRNDRLYEDAYVSEHSRGTNDWGPEVIPEGYYFVLGDNRVNSADSRHWGYVPEKYIFGRVAFRWWPLSGAGGL